MKVVIVEVGKKARIEDIDGSLENMQKIVGGYITATYPFKDQVAIVCDDEGAYKHPINRWIDKGVTAPTGIFGTFFICGLTEEDFGDLTDAQARKYVKLFKYPEGFIKMNNKVYRVRIGSKEPPAFICEGGS